MKSTPGSGTTKRLTGKAGIARKSCAFMLSNMRKALATRLCEGSSAFPNANEYRRAKPTTSVRKTAINVQRCQGYDMRISPAQMMFIAI
jgi:hypothetical protein